MKAYLASIGRRGGRKSRRALDPEPGDGRCARGASGVRDSSECFWSFDPQSSGRRTFWVVEQLQHRSRPESRMPLPTTRDRCSQEQDLRLIGWSAS